MCAASTDIFDPPVSSGALGAYLPLTGGALSGNLTVRKGNAAIILDGSAASIAQLYFRKSNVNAALVYNDAANDRLVFRVFDPADGTTVTAEFHINSDGYLESFQEHRGVTPDVTTGHVKAFVTKEYVDALAGGADRVLKAGDTMTGTLNLPAGTDAIPALTFGDSDTRFWMVGTENLVVTVAGNAHLVIKSAFNLNSLTALSTAANGGELRLNGANSNVRYVAFRGPVDGIANDVVIELPSTVPTTASQSLVIDSISGAAPKVLKMKWSDVAADRVLKAGDTMTGALVVEQDSTAIDADLIKLNSTEANGSEQIVFQSQGTARGSLLDHTPTASFRLQRSGGAGMYLFDDLARFSKRVEGIETTLADDPVSLVTKNYVDRVAYGQIIERAAGDVNIGQNVNIFNRALLGDINLPWAGKYKVSYRYEWTAADLASQLEAFVNVNNVAISTHIQRVNTVAGPGSAIRDVGGGAATVSGNSIRYQHAGFSIVTMNQGANNLNMDFKSFGGGLVSLFNPQIIVEWFSE